MATPHADGAADFEIYMVNADGSGVTRVTHTPWSEQAPAWSPGGRHLAIASSPAGNLDIYVYDVSNAIGRRP